jgi:hypothetical protein
MTSLCAFCRSELLNDQEWLPNTPRHHHGSLETLAQSLHEACLICTLLVEIVRSAMLAADACRRHACDDLDGSYFRSVAPRTPLEPDPERDKIVRDTTVEDLLLAWIAENKTSVESAMPLYEAVLQDGPVDNVWYISFQQPRLPSSLGSTGLFLPTQRFVIYDVCCECDRTADLVGSSSADVG